MTLDDLRTALAGPLPINLPEVQARIAAAIRDVRSAYFRAGFAEELAVLIAMIGALLATGGDIEEAKRGLIDLIERIEYAKRQDVV